MEHLRKVVDLFLKVLNVEKYIHTYIYIKNKTPRNCQSYGNTEVSHFRD